MVHLVTSFEQWFLMEQFLWRFGLNCSSSSIAVQATIPSNSPYSWLQSAFGHHITFCQRVLINWDCLKWIHKNKAGKNNAEENSKHREQTYHAGNLVLLLLPTHEWYTKFKLQCPPEGHNTINKVFTNGAISIRHGHGDEFVSINCIWPYHTQP